MAKVDELKRAISLREDEIREEVKELLDKLLCDRADREEAQMMLCTYTPEERADMFMSVVREDIDSEIGDLPCRNTVLDLLTKLYLHLAYVAVCGGREAEQAR